MRLWVSEGWYSRNCVNNRDLKLVVRGFQDNDWEFTLSFFSVPKP